MHYHLRHKIAMGVSRYLDSGKHPLRGPKVRVLQDVVADVGILSIESIYATHGDAHDSPIIRVGLVSQAQFQNGKKIHGDKAYFAEESINPCEELGA